MHTRRNFPSSVKREDIARVLRDKIRLVAGDSLCENCGDPISWRVKPGNIEECARAVLALFPTHAQAGEAWRPIKTAPKDGTRILAYSALAPGEKMRVTWWRQEKDRADYIGWGEFNPVHWPPTHWCPLPAPPPSQSRD